MDNQIYPVSESILPKVVTEPSPTCVQNGSVGSLVKKTESITEVSANGAPSELLKQSLEQATAIQAPSANHSSGEFVTAQECNQCIVPVPEESTAQQLESTSTSTSTSSSTATPDQDNFRTSHVGCCSNFGIQCILYYEKAWDIIHSRYALPFWLLFLALPISSGYMGALYMYSCPASHSLPLLNFTIGISLMAVVSFRICLIIRRMTRTAEGDEWGNMLHTLLLISTFLSIVFFITESMAFWKMEPVDHPGCDSNFVTFSFWWNCVMSVAVVPIILFPA